MGEVRVPAPIRRQPRPRGHERSESKVKRDGTCEGKGCHNDRLATVTEEAKDKNGRARPTRETKHGAARSGQHHGRDGHGRAGEVQSHEAARGALLHRP